MKELLIGLLTKDFVDFGGEENGELELVFDPPKKYQAFCKAQARMSYRENFSCMKR